MKKENLDDYLNERNKKVQDEKEKTEEVLMKLKEAQEEYKKQYLQVVTKVIRPTLTALNKKFSPSGHSLQLKRDNLQMIPFEIEYTLTMRDGRSVYYTISFFGNRKGCDILFYFHTPSTPNNNYKREFKFDEITSDAIEQEIVKGLKFFEK